MSREQAPRAAGKRPAANFGNFAGSERRDVASVTYTIKERTV